MGENVCNRCSSLIGGVSGILISVTRTSHWRRIKEKLTKTTRFLAEVIEPMGLESHDAHAVTGKNTDVQSALLEGTWNKPQPSSTTTDTGSRPAKDTSSASVTDVSSAPPDSKIADSLSTPTFVNGDGSSLSGKDLVQAASMRISPSDNAPIEVASMSLGNLSLQGDGQPELIQVADRRTSNRSGGTADALMSAARDSVGESKLGNRVPKGASEFAGMVIEQNVQCASTSSDWLMQSGFMRERDYKISVTGLSQWLGEHGFRRVPLSGDFDISKFPDGPIGFIAGTRNVSDGSNHIGFIEKRNGEVRVIHNNWRTGAVVDQNINEKFYDENGKPQYKNMSLYILPRR